jgi:hypothetical protein
MSFQAPRARDILIAAAEDSLPELMPWSVPQAEDTVAPSKSVMLAWACGCGTRVVCSTRCSVGRITAQGERPTLPPRFASETLWILKQCSSLASIIRDPKQIIYFTSLSCALIFSNQFEILL